MILARPEPDCRICRKRPNLSGLLVYTDSHSLGLEHGKSLDSQFRAAKHPFKRAGYLNNIDGLQIIYRRACDPDCTRALAYK